MSFAIGLSGLNAAAQRLEASALEISRAALPLGSQTAMPNSMDAPMQAAKVLDSVSPPNSAGGLDVDLPNAVIAQISASAAFLANMNTIRRTDENQKALLQLR